MKRSNLSLGIASCVLSLLCTRAPAFAQSARAPVITEGDDKPWSKDVPVAERQAALDLFLEGNKLFDIPLLARAADKYKAALAHWKHPSIYFNLALAEFSLGQDVDAHAHFAEALKYGPAPVGEEWYAPGKQKLAQLEQTLGQIHVACPTSGAEVLLDGVPIFTGPGQYDGWAKNGSHEVAARKPEYLSQVRRVAVASGQVKRVNLDLLTIGEAAEHGRRWSPWISWVVVGTGAALAITGGAFHFRSKSNFDSYDDRFQRQCPQGCPLKQIPDNLMNQLSRANRDQDLAVTGYIVGGGALAAGLVLLYLNRPRLLEDQETTSTRAPGVAVVPTIAPGELGVSILLSR